MGVNNPEPAYFWDEATQGWRKALVGEPGEFVWNTTTNAWEKGTIGAEYLWNGATNSWGFGPGGRYVRNTSTNSWELVRSPGYGGRYYWDDSTNSWLKNSDSAPAGTAYARWDFINNQAWFNRTYVGALSNTPGWSFTRASTGYAQNAAGVLLPFASGELRRTDKGVLIEGARTNLCLQSQTFDNASWTKTNITLTADDLAAPDGTSTADKFVETNTSSSLSAVASAFSVASGSTYTLSLYILPSNVQWFRLVLADGTGFTNGIAKYFDLTGLALGTTATLGSGWSLVSANIERVGAYIRISMAVTTGATTAAIGFRSATADNGSTRVTNGAYWLWGSQCELGAFPSSYIPTTTASATRAADVLTVPVSGIESAPLSAYAEFTVDSLTGTERGIFSVDDGAGAANIGAYLYGTTANAGRALCYASGATQMDAGATALTAATVTKLAMRAATNDGRVCQNGTLQTADTSLVLCSTLNKIAFGARYWGGGSQLFGYLRRCALWTRALSDSELTAVTST